MKKKSTRFSAIPSKAVFDPDLSATSLKVLAALGTHSDMDGYCWPSHGSLADDLRISKKTVRRGLAQLISLGYIKASKRVRTDGSQTSNGYFILFDQAVEKASEEVIDTDTPPTPKMTTPLVKNDHPPGHLDDHPYMNKPIELNKKEKNKTKKEKFWDGFEEFWKIYTPIKVTSGKHVAKGPKGDAFERYVAALKEISHVDLLVALQCYLNHCRQNDRYTLQVFRWLKDRKYLEEWDDDNVVCADPTAQQRRQSSHPAALAAQKLIEAEKRREQSEYA